MELPIRLRVCLGLAKKETSEIPFQWLLWGLARDPLSDQFGGGCGPATWGWVADWRLLAQNETKRPMQAKAASLSKRTERRTYASGHLGLRCHFMCGTNAGLRSGARPHTAHARRASHASQNGVLGNYCCLKNEEWADHNGSASRVRRARSRRSLLARLMGAIGCISREHDRRSGERRPSATRYKSEPEVRVIRRRGQQLCRTSLHWAKGLNSGWTGSFIHPL